MNLDRFHLPRSPRAQLAVCLALFCTVPLILVATGNLPKVALSLSNQPAPPAPTPGMQIDVAQILKLVKEHPIEVRTQKTKLGTVWSVSSPSKNAADDKPTPEAIAEALKYLESVEVPTAKVADHIVEPDKMVEPAAPAPLQPPGIAVAVPQSMAPSAADVEFPKAPNAADELAPEQVASSKPAPIESPVTPPTLYAASAPAAAKAPTKPAAKPAAQYYYDPPRRGLFGRRW